MNYLVSYSHSMILIQLSPNKHHLTFLEHLCPIGSENT